MEKNIGQKIFQKYSTKLILGGNMLLSKHPDMILPKLWPTYYSKSKKSFVWDLEKKKYLDAICLVGQSTLGYANPIINRAVKEKISAGNITSLNSKEEVDLAKILVDAHPWAHMCKFAKSGGEANAIAIRIARAASKKDHVAICGYHGWHDWYLSVNLNSKKNNLDSHLFPGLEPIGVPKVLRKTVHPFTYGDFHSLEKIQKKYDLGVVKMEVARNTMPDIKFLKKVRDFCTRKKIILIFDECTSGFRRNFGGIHMNINIFPDIAMFGKALGNGYPITSVIGKADIMNKASKSFISSTLWSEGIGFSAAIATLKEMKRIKSWKKLIKNGKNINSKWIALAKKHSLSIKLFGIESISSFSLNKKKDLMYKTFITQELMKSNILGSNLIYCNIYHSNKLMEKYFNVLDRIFKKISDFESGENCMNYLNGPVCRKPFKRINS